MQLRKTLRFESAHRLPRLPATHKCARLHGHSFVAEVAVEGEVDPRFGWVIDFATLSAACDPLVEALDHRYLNEVEGLENPTSENLAIWFWDRLAPRLPGLCEIVVAETCDLRCVYRGPGR